MKTFIQVFLDLGLCLAAWSAGVSPVHAAEAPNPQKGSAPKIFTFRIPGDPETLDWNLAHTPVETNILVNIMEGLVAFDPKLKAIPALAKSWEISKDHRTYTFKLRGDVKWSDGVPLKANDFVFSWKRLLSPGTAASYAYLLFDIEGAEAFYQGKSKDFSTVGVKAIDALTFQVKLAQPVAHWIDIPTFWVTFPLREDIVSKYGNSWDRPGRMVNLGPFSLAEYELDSKVVLKSNPTYYGTHGNLDQVVALVIKDSSTALNLYEAGKIDFISDLGMLDLKKLQGRPDLKSFPYLKTAFLTFSVNRFPVGDVKVRRALAMAIDKSKIAELLHGGQTPATSFIPPGLIGYSAKMGLKFNPAAAKAELKAGSWDPTRPVSLDLISLNWDKALFLGEYIQGELKRNLGVDINLQPFDHKSLRGQLDLHAFPLFLTSWSADYPDPDNFLSVFLSASGNNHTTWKNQKFDENVLKARHSIDPHTRINLYTAAQKQLIEDEAVLVPLFYEPVVALVKARVSGLEVTPVNYMELRKVNLGL